MGLGDYQHDFEYQGEFDPWLDSFWPQLQKMIPKQLKSESVDLLPSIYKIEVLDSETEENSKLSQLQPYLGAINQQVFISKVISNTRLTAKDHFQDTRQIVLDLDREDLVYDPGDILMVLPKNDESIIKEFIQRLGFKDSQTLKISLDQGQLG